MRNKTGLDLTNFLVNGHYGFTLLAYPDPSIQHLLNTNTECDSPKYAGWNWQT